MLVGRIFESSSGAVHTPDGGVVCRRYGERFYAFALPQVDRGAFVYQDVELALRKITPKVRKSLLGKSKLEVVSVVLSDNFGVVAHTANRLDTAGHPDRTDRLAEFCKEFGAEP